MIEIIPLESSLFTPTILHGKKLTKYTYLVDIDLVSKFMVTDLPI